MRPAPRAHVHLQRFGVLTLVAFVAVWAIGALTVAGLLPQWVFPTVLFPSGVLYTWFESHWTGTQYVFSGRTVSDFDALMLAPIVALLQGAIYVAIWAAVERCRSTTRELRA
jgi:hypothetical protein